MHESMASTHAARDLNSIPELPEDIQLEYLAEGGANIVYRILISTPSHSEVALLPSETGYYGNATPPPTEVEEHDLTTDNFNSNDDVDDSIDITSGKLLRLRKNVRFGLPYSHTASDFRSQIRPLFHPEELVDQFLVRVPPALVRRCNEKLRDSERMGKRHVMRHGVYLATDEPMGMLITDMTNPVPVPSTRVAAETAAAAAEEEETIKVAEIKPKWLVQSPSAPKGARRCRTCALRDMKAADGATTTPTTTSTSKNKALYLPPPGKASFCPLDLISTNEQDLQRTISTTIFAHHHHRTTPSNQLLHTVTRALYRHPTLLKLQNLQRLHNNVGLLGPGSGSSEMSLSMTLRDCSVFVKISPLITQTNTKTNTDTEIDIDIRLGDLDLKSAANGKAEYWLGIEKRLICEGWYMGQQPSQAKTEGECVLSR